MQPLNSLHAPGGQREEGADYLKVILRFARNWYWFLVSIIIAVGAVFAYNKYMGLQRYMIDSNIMITEDTKHFKLEDLFQKSMMNMGNDLTIGNEIGLLHSYALNYRVFEGLNWRTSWYRRNFLKWEGLYSREPFLVEEKPGEPNMEDLNLVITPFGDNSYIIEAKGWGLMNNVRQPVRFSGKGKFGEPFDNEYFHFTLHLSKSMTMIRDEKFAFRFNNLHSLTNEYLGKVKIGHNDKKNEIIRLMVEGNEPLRNVDYLNALINEYKDYKLKVRTETNKRSLDFIDAQLSGISDSLNAAGNSVTRFRSNNQVVDISAQGGLVMQQLRDIEREKAESQMQLKYFQNLLSYLGNTDSIRRKMVVPSVVGVQDAALNAVVLKLSDLYSRREILSFSTHESNPTWVLLNREIKQVTSQLRENLVNLIDNAKLNIKNMQERQDVISGQLNNLPVKEQKLIDIRRQYELTSGIYTFLLQKRAELDIMLNSVVSEVQIMDPATRERVKESGIPPNILYVLALFLGIGLPAFVIVMAGKLTDTIQVQEDVRQLTSLSIIGNIPHAQGKTEMIVAKNPRAVITESFRTIRTNLKYMLSRPDQKVISIHSVRPGEGKSFNALNLSCVLAMNEKKVLLIGADMRRPQLNKSLGIKKSDGLSTYLIGQSEYEEIVTDTSIPNLWYVPSGPIPPNPAELLERGLFKELIERARADFDYVVIDNAPLSLVTEGLITCRLSDLNIIILRYGISRKDQIHFINDMVKREMMVHPALVINDIRTGRFGYGYNYSYIYKDKRSADYFGVAKKETVQVTKTQVLNGAKQYLNF